jgi:hypothetical protein
MESRKRRRESGRPDALVKKTQKNKKSAFLTKLVPHCCCKKEAGKLGYICNFENIYQK